LAFSFDIVLESDDKGFRNEISLNMFSNLLFRKVTKKLLI